MGIMGGATVVMDMSTGNPLLILSTACRYGMVTMRLAGMVLSAKDLPQASLKSLAARNRKYEPRMHKPIKATMPMVSAILFRKMASMAMTMRFPQRRMIPLTRFHMFATVRSSLSRISMRPHLGHLIPFSIRSCTKTIQHFRHPYLGGGGGGGGHGCIISRSYLDMIFAEHE